LTFRYLAGPGPCNLLIIRHLHFILAFELKLI